MSDMLCLYFGNSEECQNCGGWIHADGCVPEGFPAIDDKYCSDECHEEALDFQERRRRAVRP